MDMVGGENGPWLSSQNVNPTSIGQNLHDVVDVIVLDPIFSADSCLWTPTPTDRDSGVGQVSDFIMSHSIAWT